MSDIAFRTDGLVNHIGKFLYKTYDRDIDIQITPKSTLCAGQYYYKILRNNSLFSFGYARESDSARRVLLDVLRVIEADGTPWTAYGLQAENILSNHKCRVLLVAFFNRIVCEVDRPDLQKCLCTCDFAVVDRLPRCRTAAQAKRADRSCSESGDHRKDNN